jgi:hypothetical protein
MHMRRIKEKRKEIYKKSNKNKDGSVTVRAACISKRKTETKQQRQQQRNIEYTKTIRYNFCKIESKKKTNKQKKQQRKQQNKETKKQRNKETTK